MDEEEANIPVKPERAKYLVLLAEDDPSLSEILSMELKLAGYSNLVHAENGAIALDYIEQYKPKIVLMDDNMPVLKGIDAIEQLKAKGYDMSLFKLIFLANSSNDENMQRAKALNAEYRIKAGLSPADLTLLIDEAVGI